LQQRYNIQASKYVTKKIKKQLSKCLKMTAVTAQAQKVLVCGKASWEGTPEE